MEGVVFTLTTNLLLVLSSNRIDEKKNVIFFLFLLSFRQMIHCLKEQIQMIHIYYIWLDLEEALTAEPKDLYYSSALISF